MSYRVKDCMRRDIVTVDAEASAAVASKIMMENSVGSLIVLENDPPAGIVTEWDLLPNIMAEEREPSKVKVSEAMSTLLVTIDPDSARSFFHYPTEIVLSLI
jgi:CBS domain-containing protein